MEHQHTPSKPESSKESSGAFLKHTEASTPDFREAVEKGYEPHDIGLRGIILFVGGLAVTLVVVLSFIYAVMMALADYDRSKDALASPVKVDLPPQYAPLQPSLGFYGNHDQDHDLLDWEDMTSMRAQVDDVLANGGPNRLPISVAIDKVLPLIQVRAVVPPVIEMPLDPGSREGVYLNKPDSSTPNGVHVNDESYLNGKTER